MKLFLTLTLVLLLSHCGGTTVNISPGLDKKPPRTLGILPFEFPSDTQRERIEYLRTTLIDALEGKGYVVLDDSILTAACTSPTCPEKAALARKYNIDSFVTLKLDSVSRVNFLIGFYNTISGTLSLVDSSGEILASIENSEHERGGLLFRSGQIFEGIRSTVNNAADKGYIKLSDRFVRTLSLKFPAAPSTESIAKRVNVAINSASIVPAKRGAYEVCASAPSGLMLSLVLDRVRAPLRVTSSGNYCGTFLLDGIVRPSTRVAIEARSPYGITMQRELSRDNLASCDLDGLVQTNTNDMKSVFLIGCDSVNDPEKKKVCEEQFTACNRSTFAFYRSSSEAGPFQQVARVGTKSWTDRTPDSHYAVVAVNPHGSISPPIALERREQ